jgi:hypothetical protein
MMRLLQETCIKVSKSEAKKLDGTDLAELHKRYRAILTSGAKELTVIPPKPSEKRGKLAKSAARAHANSRGIGIAVRKIPICFIYQ